MADSFTLTIFRHGLTIENEKRQYLGWTDAALSARGVSESLSVAGQIKAMSPDKLITSDLIRCRQTAKLLFPSENQIEMEDFREMNFGEFEGKSYGDLKNNKSYQEWLDSAFKIPPINGESFDFFSNRIWNGMKKALDILDEEDRELVIMSHGGVIRLLLSRLVESGKEFFDWNIPNSQAYQLKWENIESFRRLEKCKSLSVVPSMEKING